jgi:hypothetical protein
MDTTGKVQTDRRLLGRSQVLEHTGWTRGWLDNLVEISAITPFQIRPGGKRFYQLAEVNDVLRREANGGMNARKLMEIDGVVWYLDCPNEPGLWWERNITTGDRKAMNVVMDGGDLWVEGSTDARGVSTLVSLRTYFSVARGLCAWCGPDRSPPSE